MNREWHDPGETDELGRDIELARALAVIDPATHDPNYWLRFRAWALKGASRELARRRMMARLTVGEVVGSWARTLVPTALLAAVLAGVMLWRAGMPLPVSVEELLVSEIEGETIPDMALPSRAADAVTFAAEVF
jgi:hypothetical protein